MPKKLEREMQRRAARKGLKGEQANAYVYGTIRKLHPSWEPSRAKSGDKK